MTHIKMNSCHIEYGKAGSCQFCPAALAIRDYLRDCFVVFVNDDSIELFDAPGDLNTEPLWVTDVPRIVGVFMAIIDTGWIVKPIEFDLDIPEKFLKQVA